MPDPDVRPSVRLWYSVATPFGLVEHYLPKYMVDLQPDDRRDYRELHEYANRYGEKMRVSDHPLKYCG